MRVPGGLAGVAAAVLVAGMAAIPAARAADDGAGHAAVTTAARVAAAAPASAPGTTLYVDFGGVCDDSGPGTQAEPFCTVQAAADIVDPGQTVDIEAASANLYAQSVAITRSGTPTEPITFAWAGTGADPLITPLKQTGKAVITLQDVHDVTLSHLDVESYGTDDAINVIGSSDITLTRLTVTHLIDSPTAPQDADEIMIDGASSDVTVSKTVFRGGGFQAVVLAQAGARQVTLTTNALDETTSASVFTLDDVAGATVTANTMEIDCLSGSNASTAISLADGSSGTVENNVIELLAGSTCTTSMLGLTVDASSAGSAGGVTADYNAFFSEGSSSDYSWAGVSYADPAAFTAATGQAAHDLTLANAFPTAPRAGSAAINSANCSAPGEQGTDVDDSPWVADPQATDASAGSGSCDASRGAYAPQDTFDFGGTPPALDATGYAAGAVPYTTGVTVTGPGTSGWGEPVTFTVDFGDGSTPVPASVGRAVSHTYTTAGQYTIAIIATDASGSTLRWPVASAYALPDQAPTAGLSAGPDGVGSDTGITPDTADFTETEGSAAWEIAGSSINYGGAGASYSPPAGVTWEYNYAAPGTHTATMTVTDKAGRTTTTSTAVTVGDEPQTVSPHSDYSHSVPAHGTVKIALATLLGNNCCARGALVDVIVTGDPKAGFVVVYPDGTSRPNLSTVQFAAGQWAENSTLATGSTVDFYNGSSGAITLRVVTYGVDTIMNPEGRGGWGETYAPVRPVTVLSRTSVPGGRQIAFRASGVAGVPAAASGVLLDITEAGGATAGEWETSCATACPTYGPGPYWSRGEQVTSLAMMATGGETLIQNTGAGAAYFTAYVVGYYRYTGANAVYLPAAPTRMGTVLIGARKSVTVAVRGRDGIPATGTTAVDLDLTASEATAAGTLSAYADGTPQPALVSVSYLRGDAVASRAIVAVGSDGDIRLYNGGSSTVAVNVDLLGSYYAYP